MLAAIAAGREFASRLVGRGPFNRCCCSIGPRYTTDSFCYRGFHPAGPFGPTEGLHLPPPSCSSEAGEKHERGEGWERVGRRSFTNLASCQEQEDFAHPFLLLSPGRELFPTPDGAQQEGARESWQSFPSGKRNAVAAHFYDLPTRIILFFP